MRRCRGAPDLLRVNSRYQNLPVAEFQQFLEIGLHKGNRQAFRNEEDRPPRALQGVRNRIIITDRRAPLVQHTDSFEYRSPNRGAAAPAEISALLAQHGYNWRIPSC